jgi:hypothetical protein
VRRAQPVLPVNDDCATTQRAQARTRMDEVGSAHEAGECEWARSVQRTQRADAREGEALAHGRDGGASAHRTPRRRSLRCRHCPPPAERCYHRARRSRWSRASRVPWPPILLSQCPPRGRRETLAASPR